MVPVVAILKCYTGQKGDHGSGKIKEYFTGGRILSRILNVSGAVDVKRVMCETPVLSTVAVDEPYHRFFPYFVRLHRCQGSCGHKSPNIKRCVATEYKNIKITVHDSTNGWQQKEITVQNHTSCGHQCKASASDCDLQVQEWNEQSCECKCLYSHSPPPKEVIKPRKGFR